MKIKIYFVFHSCFIVETDSCYMMFDYYKNFNCEKGQNFDFDSLLNTISKSDKQFYIFSSHSHSDHYNKKIFEFNFSNTQYILSDDIKLDKALPNVHYLNQGNTLRLGSIVINTFSSTDLGLSFMIEVDGMVIFYAGDLNWWAWNDDTKEESGYMENLYKSIINQIISYDKQIDTVFFPVDERLEENYGLGADYFIEKLKPKLFIPMHSGNISKTAEMFYNQYQHKHLETKIIKIVSTNQKII